VRVGGGRHAAATSAIGFFFQVCLRQAGYILYIESLVWLLLKIATEIHVY
jgi:hypothetical protein